MVDGDGIIARQLLDAFPGWNIWRSHDDDGKPRAWYATRDHVLTGDEMYAGLSPTIAADTVHELRARLQQQAEREQQINEAANRVRPRDDAPAQNPAYL